MDEQKLREYFNFDEADLEANRKGRLTDKQKKRFKPQASPKESGTWVMGLIFLLVAGIGLIVGVTTIIQGPDLVMRIVFGLVFGLIWPLIWGTIGWWILKPERRVASTLSVKAERGRLKVIKHEAPDSIPYYELRVGEFSVETDHDLTGIVKERDEYAFYYIQTTKQVVSIERVKKSD